MNRIVDYNSCFKSIYYTLYSNDSASRAETIVSDISKLLLYKLLVEKRKKAIKSGITGIQIIKELNDELPNQSTKYTDFNLSDESINSIIDSLNGITISNAPSHIVGDAFQTIIGSRIRGDKGQFFTPKELVECMVSMLDLKEDSTIIDPACGTGGFLQESFSRMKEQFGLKDINCNLIGIDKDRDMADIAFATSAIALKGKTRIFNSNSLEIVDSQNELNYLIGTADYVFTNPPFGAKIGITSEAILSQYDFGHNWAFIEDEQKWIKLESLVKNQAPQILFIELCVKLLKPHGILSIVLPEGIFGNGTFGYIWDYLKHNGRIIAMIDCPRNTFQPSTDTKTNVLVFEKGADYTPNIMVAIAKECGHDKRGRVITSSGQPWQNDFSVISDAYRYCGGKIWHPATLTGSYYVPRYLASKAEYSYKNGFITIGELINQGFLKKKKGKEIGSESYGTGDIPYIRTSDINNFEISSDPTNSVSEEIYEQYAKQQGLSVGDILFIADGRYRIGKTAIITPHNIKCLIQSHIVILSLKDTAPFTPYELLYCLNTDIVQEQIRSYVFIQSTLGTLGNRILEIEIPLPEKNDEWTKKIHAFQKNIEMRAQCLDILKQYEHSQSL